MISIHTSSAARYPAGSGAWSPGERYPEYPFGEIADTPNSSYEMLRKLFQQAGLDAARYGTPQWNPLGALVPPGSRVFVLCNFVYHRRPQESELDFQAKCIHGSVLRALIDYVLLAVGPQGRVRFGNSPLQSCNWNAVLEDTGAARVVDFYRAAGAPVEAKDLRFVVAERNLLGRVTSFEARDSAKEAVEIDLAGDSLLSELISQGDPVTRFRVADYDPRRTEAFHAGRSHRYVIHREVLESDVVISLSKLKTHEKVGITCGLKGFVGTVGHKDCLAHHRFGSAEVGGDEYPRSLRFLQPFSSFQDWLSRRPLDSTFQGAFQVADRSLRRVLRRLGAVQGGAWWGNETCWRMALDLARIVRYADRHGRMHEKPQRTHLSLIDGIVAGEGDGPLSPEPVVAGTLVFGDEVALADRVACRLMGFPPDRVHLVSEAFRPHLKYPVARREEGTTLVRANGDEVPESKLEPVLGRPFRPPSGWRGHLESPQ